MQPCEALNKHLAAANAKGIKKQSVASTILWEKNARGKGDKNASHTAKQKWKENRCGNHTTSPHSATYDDADFVVQQSSTMNEKMGRNKIKNAKGSLFPHNKLAEKNKRILEFHGFIVSMSYIVMPY